MVLRGASVSDGNGYDALRQIEDLREEVREVASNAPRIGRLEQTTILQGAALNRIEVLIRESNTNTNNLRLELAFQADEKRKEDDGRWETVIGALTTLIEWAKTK